MEPEKASTVVDARACFSSYVALCLIWFLLAAWAGFTNLKRPNADWQMVYATAGIGIALAAWLRSFQLRIAGDVLTYRSLLSRGRSVRHSEIESAKIEVNFARKFGAPQALVIRRTVKSEPTVKINTKVFSRQDLKQIFDWLGPKLHSPRRIGIIHKEPI